MNEQLDLLGGPPIRVIPAVPAVIFHGRSFRRPIRGDTKILCGHCEMNARHRHDDPLSIPQWQELSDIIILRAGWLITQTDGSTLYLCDQHADEHQQRGDHHV